eukprot:gnl/TRDRNA2_/TRDRNA2_35706_c0_seq1.p1 gnl/TRDRNA2_/TRDRNA2_35706_c0~~gnl/TRDRNA2_/TRDRNA2_35706_c0_seq1.p1  ORF type:complete len:620 (+),score=123.52 gnl/TRDRNA2_/TRDRNA2_35706_c0_seq1:280-1860(+)
MEGSPPKVALHVLHMRSTPLGVANAKLSQGLDSARRLDALEWLVQAFDALNLPDSQLFAAFGLLDRFAAASPAPISAGPGAFALVLAAMLVALKVSGTQKDLERAKRLVVEVSGSSRPWAAVRRAELLILRRLGFRACTPTARDLLDRLLDSALPAEVAKDSAWDLDSRNRCAELARFLLELGLVHEPEAVYGPGRPPLAAALSALMLSLLALNSPPGCLEVLREPLRLLDPGDAVIRELSEAMRQRWVMEEKRVNGGGGSAVMEKWLRRVGSFGASPPSPCELKFLAPEPQKVLSPAKRKDSIVPGASVSQAVVSIAEPSSRLEQASDAPEPAVASASTDQQHACQLVSTQDSMTTSRYPPAQLMSQLSRAAATENLSAWPLPGQQEAQPSSPQPATAKGARQAAASSVDGGAAARSPEPSARAAPEPLVELTHVLNMVAPRPGCGAGASTDSARHAGKSDGSKQKPPSVAAELLVSSALRMQWAVDRRKVGLADAVRTCRDAAMTLQEAQHGLSDAARQPRVNP